MPLWPVAAVVGSVLRGIRTINATASACKRLGNCVSGEWWQSCQRGHLRAAGVGHAAAEGALWRRVVLDGAPMTEHVYANPAAGEIRFVPVDGEQEGVLEVVHELQRSPLRIEHYQRDRVTLQRVHWSAPRPRIVAAIEATVQLAKAAEAEAADTSFHKKEFPS